MVYLTKLTIKLFANTGHKLPANRRSVVSVKGTWGIPSAETEVVTIKRMYRDLNATTLLLCFPFFSGSFRARPLPQRSEISFHFS